MNLIMKDKKTGKILIPKIYEPSKESLCFMEEYLKTHDNKCTIFYSSKTNKVYNNINIVYDTISNEYVVSSARERGVTENLCSALRLAFVFLTETTADLKIPLKPLKELFNNLTFQMHETLTENDTVFSYEPLEITAEEREMLFTEVKFRYKKYIESKETFKELHSEPNELIALITKYMCEEHNSLCSILSCCNNAEFKVGFRKKDKSIIINGESIPGLELVSECEMCLFESIKYLQNSIRMTLLFEIFNSSKFHLPAKTILEYYADQNLIKSDKSLTDLPFEDLITEIEEYRSFYKTNFPKHAAKEALIALFKDIERG